MRTRLLFALLVALALLPALHAQKTTHEYTELLKQIKSGDTGIDYARLRLSWMDSEERKKTLDTSAEEKSLFTLLQSKDYAKALKNANTVLSSEFVNIDAHYVASVAQHELGDEARASFHHTVFRGLVQSILDSGSGVRPEKAFVVISVHEEYVVLHALGFMPSSQSVLHQDGHSYDEMKVKAKDGSEITLYFNVDIPFAHYGF